MVFWLRNSCPSPHLFWTLVSQLAETFLLIVSAVLFLFLQPVLSFGVNCAKLIALLYNFKALGDFTKKNVETNPSFSWELSPEAQGLE